MLHFIRFSVLIRITTLVYLTSFTASVSLAQTEMSITVKVYFEGMYQAQNELAKPLYTTGISPDLMHSDSIDIMLVEAYPPHQVLLNKRALLKSNGIAVASYSGNYLNQSCYIVVKHRNSVECWSKLPVIVSSNMYYNFSGLDQFPIVETLSPQFDQIAFKVSVAGNVYVSTGTSPVLDRGFCLSTQPNPAIDFAQVFTVGSGSGSFSKDITQLQYNTTYYIRAFATNSVGTSYGSTMTFLTGPNPCGGMSTVTDIDQNSYNVVPIGGQCWMQENLRVLRYRNSELIPTAQDLGIYWDITDSGACAANYSLPASGFATYYNWYAVVDPRGLCPTGWHVPAENDWNVLTTRVDPTSPLGGPEVPFFTAYSYYGGGELKSTATSMQASYNAWLAPNSGATNSSGFTALPAGVFSLYSSILNPDGSYTPVFSVQGLGMRTDFWSTANWGSTYTFSRVLTNSSPQFIKLAGPKTQGLSVRCVKD